MSCPELRPYQVDVLERGRARLRAGARRLLIQAATGSGKGHILAELCRLAVAKGSRVVVLIHRRRIIQQISERLTLFGVPHGVVMADMGDGMPYRPDAPVQIASRDTLLSRSVRKGVRGVSLPPADLCAVDEAHNLLSDQYMELVGNYGRAVVVGFTATPARSDGKGLGDYFDAMECAVPTSQLVREGWLVPVRCYAPDRKKCEKRGLVGNPVQEWLRHAAGRPTVLFAPKVAQSVAARDAFLAAGIAAEHVDAQTPDAERDAVIERVRSGATKVVSNVNVWTEGVDIPELSCCVLLRQAGSYVLFAQAVGRVMRSHPGKADAVLLDHSGAVARHGFPDEDVEWELKESETVDERIRAKRERDGTPAAVTCPRCGLQYRAGPACPSCGHQIRKKRAKGERGASEDGLLFEVPRGRQEAQSREEMLRYWRRCLGVMAHRGQSAAAASAMFKAKFGRWPDFGLPDVPAPHERQQRVADLYPQYLGR
jgi:DNA repair protein RadD